MKFIVFNFKIVLLIALVVTAISCSQQQKKNQTLFYGGTILTVDKEFSEVEALVIEDKKIIASGNLSDMKERFDKTANMIDLQGHTMLPGFIDPHAHVVTFAPIVFMTEDIGLVKFKTT